MPYLTVDCDLQKLNLDETGAQRWLQEELKGAIEVMKAKAREEGRWPSFTAPAYEWVKKGHILRAVVPYKGEAA
ncbi:MAG: hypothetical protein U0990_06345 [Candidatus Nanopelagicales bacterium]|nr:hypothetical protein [Candidatus Nanopelagicales bacterium]